MQRPEEAAFVGVAVDEVGAPRTERDARAPGRQQLPQALAAGAAVHAPHPGHGPALRRALDVPRRLVPRAARPEALLLEQQLCLAAYGSGAQAHQRKAGLLDERTYHALHALA